MKKLFVFLLLFVSINPVFADEYTELIAYRDSLKQQIETIDSEIARCEKSLKGWKAATILGSVGTVASGIGIIAKNHQIKENKKVLNEIAEQKEKSDVTQDFMQEVKK
ncbi:MAG: hypothetical protein ACLRFM_02325 [Alphaproteobacteria bacterium]